MRPVHESPQVIPLIHAADMDTIAHAQRYAPGEVEVVRDQQCSAITNIENKALVARAVIVVRQQARYEACDFDPLPGVAFVECSTQQTRFIAADSVYPVVTGTIVISTRRLAWRPPEEPLSATGRNSPMPSVISRSEITPCDLR